MVTSSFFRIAKREQEESEYSGGQANPRIVQYLETTSLSSQYANTDETPWCSGFVNWVVTKAGLQGTNSAAAVSWMNWGVATNDPSKGTIVVFRWPNGSHHVGFVLSLDDDGMVSVLGGNQSNKVSVARFKQSSVLGYRNPVNNFFSKRTIAIVVSVVLVISIVGIIIYKYRKRKKKN